MLYMYPLVWAEFARRHFVPNWEFKNLMHVCKAIPNVNTKDMNVLQHLKSSYKLCLGTGNFPTTQHN